MTKATIAAARRAESIGQQICVQGWVRTRRDSKGGFSFLEVNDGSCLANLQIIADASLPNYESEIKRLGPGCSVTVDGRSQSRPAGKGQATELLAARVVVHGWADPEAYPLQKKRHSFEKLARVGPSAAADQHLRRRRRASATASAARSTTSSRKKASSTSTRRSSRPATAKGPARCSRSRR